MMKQGPLGERIIEAFDGMSGQLQKAARYVLDRPRDVALLSMREQARQAGVQPATMTRLAKFLGLEGYDDLRECYAGAIRDGDFGFTGGAGRQVASQVQKGDRALAADMLQSIARQIGQMGTGETLDRLAAGAECLATARRVYCLGLRSSHPVAWHLHYVLSLLGERSRHLDGIGGTGPDLLAGADERDVLFAASVFPYTRLTVELAEYAARRGLPVVAVTDSAVSPLGLVARHAIIVPADSPSFFHAISPAFAIAEVLGAIVAGRGGDQALAQLRQTDAHLAALGTHRQSRPSKRPS